MESKGPGFFDRVSLHHPELQAMLDFHSEGNDDGNAHPRTTSIAGDIFIDNM